MKGEEVYVQPEPSKAQFKHFLSNFPETPQADLFYLRCFTVCLCVHICRDFFCLRVLTLPVHLWLLSFFTVLVTESNHLYFCMSSMWLLLLYSHSSYCLQFIAFEWLSIKLIQVIQELDVSTPWMSVSHCQQGALVISVHVRPLSLEHS